jgi:TonB family protein
MDLSQKETTVEATLEPQQEPTPPPEEIIAPPPPPEPEVVKPEFREEVTPPPRVRPQKVVAIKAPPLSISRAKALAISAPRPAYPYEARARRITGSGVCVVDVDPGSGAVTEATMAQSTGSPILDNSAVSAFRNWRFRPGTVSKVRIPITYTLTGVSY